MRGNVSGPMKQAVKQADRVKHSVSIAPTGRARCRKCKGLVAKGSVRLVTWALVCERPRRSTAFVRHEGCVDRAFAAAILQSHGGLALNVPVIGDVSVEDVDRVRAMLSESAK